MSTLGVKFRNMKMDFNIYGTWRRVMFEKVMMKIYDFFIWLSHYQALQAGITSKLKIG